MRFRTSCTRRIGKSVCPAAVNLSIRIGSFSPPPPLRSVQKLGALYYPVINAPIEAVLPAYPSWGRLDPLPAPVSCAGRNVHVRTLVQDLKLALSCLFRKLPCCESVFSPELSRYYRGRGDSVVVASSRRSLNTRPRTPRGAAWAGRSCAAGGVSVVHEMSVPSARDTRNAQAIGRLLAAISNVQ